jgi:PAS domain S-box-containing protein
MNERAPSAEAIHQALIGEAGDCAGFGVSVYDEDGRFVALNQYAAAILGYPRDELLRRDVADFTDGGIDRSVLLRSNLREGVRLVQRPDGTSVPTAFVVAPTRVANLDFFVAIWWEIPADDPRAAAAS